MKKYVKPDVVFEDFELSVGVAACTELIFRPDGNVKSYDESDPGVKTLVDSGFFGTTCLIIITKDNVYGYYGTSQTGEIFGS